MNNWLWLIPATGPIFFYIWHQWVFRWGIADLSEVTFFDRIRDHFYASLPGKYGDNYRYPIVRSRILAYARAESKGVHVDVCGIPHDDGLRRIAIEKRYMQYQDVFFPPKRLMWLMALLSLAWPVALLLVVVALIIRNTS